MTHFVKVALAVCALLTASGVGPAATISGQDEGTSPDPGGAGYFAAGLSYLTCLGDLNDALDASGYPEANRVALAVGRGGYGVLRSGLMLGGEGYGVIASNEASTAREVNYAAGMGFFNVGYQVVNERGQPVAYPFVGLGGGGATLTLEHTGADTFDDVLTNPERGATLVQAALLIHIGGGIELRGSEAARKKGPFLGLRGLRRRPGLRGLEL